LVSTGPGKASLLVCAAAKPKRDQEHAPMAELARHCETLLDKARTQADRSRVRVHRKRAQHQPVLRAAEAHVPEAHRADKLAPRARNQTQAAHRCAACAQPMAGFAAPRTRECLVEQALDRRIVLRQFGRDLDHRRLRCSSTSTARSR
jgi:hypothetical protein